MDDETIVRSHAQAALADAEALGFERVTRGEYPTRRVYVDFAAYESMMVGIDPDRAAAMGAVRDTVRDLFHEHGTPVDDGVAFDGSVVFDVLRKV